MKASIFFLGVFTAGVLTGVNIDWDSRFWGLATGVSLVRIALELIER